MIENMIEYMQSNPDPFLLGTYLVITGGLATWMLVRNPIKDSESEIKYKKAIKKIDKLAGPLDENKLEELAGDLEIFCDNYFIGK